MIAISQRDLPYLVLTYDPNLQAYRTDRLSGVEPVCPAGNGDIICDQISYEPLASTLAPGEGSSGGGGGSSTGIIIAIVAVVAGAIVFFVVRSRRRRGEPLELEE